MSNAVSSSCRECAKAARGSLPSSVIQTARLSISSRSRHSSLTGWGGPSRSTERGWTITAAPSSERESQSRYDAPFGWEPPSERRPLDMLPRVANGIQMTYEIPTESRRQIWRNHCRPSTFLSPASRRLCVWLRTKPAPLIEQKLSRYVVLHARSCPARSFAERAMGRQLRLTPRQRGSSITLVCVVMGPPSYEASNISPSPG